MLSGNRKRYVPVRHDADGHPPDSYRYPKEDAPYLLSDGKHRISHNRQPPNRADCCLLYTSLGFVNTLEEVLKKENPSHIGVAFDPSGPTFRHEAFEQYKAQREETPEADVYKRQALKGLEKRQKQPY